MMKLNNSDFQDDKPEDNNKNEAVEDFLERIDKKHYKIEKFNAFIEKIKSELTTNILDEFKKFQSKTGKMDEIDEQLAQIAELANKENFLTEMKYNNKEETNNDIITMNIKNFKIFTYRCSEVIRQLRFMYSENLTKEEKEEEQKREEKIEQAIKLIDYYYKMLSQGDYLDHAHEAKVEKFNNLIKQMQSELTTNISDEFKKFQSKTGKMYEIDKKLERIATTANRANFLIKMRCNNMEIMNKNIIIFDMRKLKTCMRDECSKVMSQLEAIKEENLTKEEKEEKQKREEKIEQAIKLIDYYWNICSTHLHESEVEGNNIYNYSEKENDNNNDKNDVDDYSEKENDNNDARKNLHKKSKNNDCCEVF